MITTKIYFNGRCFNTNKDRELLFQEIREHSELTGSNIKTSVNTLISGKDNEHKKSTIHINTDAGPTLDHVSVGRKGSDQVTLFYYEIPGSSEENGLYEIIGIGQHVGDGNSTYSIKWQKEGIDLPMSNGGTKVGQVLCLSRNCQVIELQFPEIKNQIDFEICSKKDIADLNSIQDITLGCFAKKENQTYRNFLGFLGEMPKPPSLQAPYSVGSSFLSYIDERIQQAMNNAEFLKILKEVKTFAEDEVFKSVDQCLSKFKQKEENYKISGVYIDEAIKLHYSYYDCVWIVKAPDIKAERVFASLEMRINLESIEPGELLAQVLIEKPASNDKTYDIPTDLIVEGLKRSLEGKELCVIRKQTSSSIETVSNNAASNHSRNQTKKIKKLIKKN